MNWDNDTSPFCPCRSQTAPPSSLAIRVKVSARGTFMFTVEDIDEDTGMAMIEVNADSPLTYP